MFKMPYNILSWVWLHNISLNENIDDYEHEDYKKDI